MGNALGKFTPIAVISEMIVRPFRREDYEPLWILAQKMWSESPAYRGRDLNKEKLAQLAEWIITRDEICGFVAENGDGIEGFFMGIVSEYYFGKQKMSNDLALFVEPTKRGGRAAILLIRAYEQWARSHGVQEILLGATTGVHEERTVKLYERLGYSQSGTVCSKKSITPERSA